MPRWYLDRVARGLLVTAGFLCVGLGVLGILLPGLPTTPFLLLAAFCFARSSERFHQWLLSHRWLGPYIANFEAGRGMTRRDKLITIGTLWLTMGLTIVLFVPVTWAKLAMAAVGMCTTLYLLRLPTAAPRGAIAATGPQSTSRGTRR
jgi:uncharacterized membrane protein YbaN (DUF454 family)